MDVWGRRRNEKEERQNKEKTNKFSNSTQYQGQLLKLPPQSFVWSTMDIGGSLKLFLLRFLLGLGCPFRNFKSQVDT